MGIYKNVERAPFGKKNMHFSEVKRGTFRGYEKMGGLCPTAPPPPVAASANLPFR